MDNKVEYLGLDYGEEVTAEDISIRWGGVKIFADVLTESLDDNSPKQIRILAREFNAIVKVAEKNGDHKNIVLVEEMEEVIRLLGKGDYQEGGTMVIAIYAQLKHIAAENMDKAMLKAFVIPNSKQPDTALVVVVTQDMQGRIVDIGISNRGMDLSGVQYSSGY